MPDLEYLHDSLNVVYDQIDTLSANTFWAIIITLMVGLCFFILHLSHLSRLNRLEASRSWLLKFSEKIRQDLTRLDEDVNLRIDNVDSARRRTGQALSFHVNEERTALDTIEDVRRVCKRIETKQMAQDRRLKALEDKKKELTPNQLVEQIRSIVKESEA